MRIANLDDVLAFSLQTLLRRDRTNIGCRIHLNLFQRLPRLVRVEELFGLTGQTTRAMQDRARSFGWNGAVEAVLPVVLGHEAGNRARPEDQAPARKFSGGAKRISTIRLVTHASHRK